MNYRTVQIKHKEKLKSMRLQYLYLDFTKNGRNQEGYRGYKQCELNFSTETNYTMEPCSLEKLYYCLKQKEKIENNKIEMGFWGDERIYNISAIVGENGTGKTTLIHTIMRTLETLYGETNQKLPFDFVCLLQDVEKHLYLIYSCENIEIEISSDFRCEKISYYNSDTPLTLLKKTKLIYFSNTISAADMERFHTIDHTDYKNIYTDFLYDCSLYASLVGAQEASNITSNNKLLEGVIEDQLRTYFNYESYQEARYLFDRNQRNILFKMKNQGYPVPYPRELQLAIRPSMEQLKQVENSRQNYCLSDRYLNWCHRYKEFSDQSQNRYFVLTELCLNCVANFLININLIRDYSRKHLMFPEEFTNPRSYIKMMESAFVSNIAYKDYSQINNYFQVCTKYIEFLWNNASYIQKYWKYDNDRCYIKLGEHLNPILQELMIRFVDLNRAVSMNSYFVTYHWGLSSGESILLHMFTKLRYLLQGNIYDEESPDFITEYSVQKAMLAQRKEFIENSFNNKEKMNCDSVILFFDEADLSLHPEWQRIFIATLAEYLPHLYQNPYYKGTDSGCRDIQIILTTHSPLILGDFPSDCVLYLKKDQNGFVTVEFNNSLQPFGQNLYTLLKDGFYLQNGTIGALAQKKIKSILEDVQTVKTFNWNTMSNVYYAERELEQWAENLKAHRRKTVKYLPQGIIRNKLEQEISVALTIIDHRLNPEQKEHKKQELRKDIARLQRQLDELENSEEELQ